jgi:uncharacterized membrane protein
MANTSTSGATVKPADDEVETIEAETEMGLSYIAALFDSVDEARNAYKELKEEQREGLTDILDAAYVEKTDRSRIKIYDHNEWRLGIGAVEGGVTGGVIGIIAGAILVPAAIGVLVGGVIGGIYEHETSFSHRDLRKFADSLPTGTSALVAVVEDPYVILVSDEFKNLGGKKVQSGTVPKSTAESLKSK